jgi:hypothetical protein
MRADMKADIGQQEAQQARDLERYVSPWRGVCAGDADSRMTALDEASAIHAYIERAASA